MTMRRRLGRCKHCQRMVAAIRPRGLCGLDYYNVAVRNLYATHPTLGSKRASTPDFTGPAPLPDPTATLPGSREKMLVLSERALAGQQLFHPDDAVIED